jgi:hypothetical protein
VSTTREAKLDILRANVSDWFNRECMNYHLTKEEVTTYVLAVATAETTEINEWLTTECPECATKVWRMTDEMQAWHFILAEHGADFVIIGCEGYQVVNPNALGIASPNWDDWQQR